MKEEKTSSTITSTSTKKNKRAGRGLRAGNTTREIYLGWAGKGNWNMEWRWSILNDFKRVKR